MPELPEVETVLQGLRAAKLEGARIREVFIGWHRTVAGHTPAAFAAALRGRVITRLSRRAKYLVAALDSGQHLLIHLRMTGQFRLEPAGTPADTHDRLVLHLADGRQVHFHDTRKFGRFRLVDDPHTHLADLGPEPLSDDFTLVAFRRQLADKQRQIKPLLLDQSCVAGIGNIYADESLWRARIHPTRRADTLTAPEITRLHRAIREVLAQAITLGGTTLGSGATNFYSVAGRRGQHADALQVFRRTGEPCPRCECPITRLVVGQRGTHICPHCQQAPLGNDRDNDRDEDVSLAVQIRCRSGHTRQRRTAPRWAGPALYTQVLLDKYSFKSLSLSGSGSTSAPPAV